MAKAEKYSDKWQLPLCTKTIVLVTHNLKYNFNTLYQLKHNTLYLDWKILLYIQVMVEVYETYILYIERLIVLFFPYDAKAIK